MVVIEMTSQTGFTVQSVQAEDTTNADIAPQKYETNPDGSVSVYYMVIAFVLIYMRFNYFFNGIHYFLYCTA